MRRPPLQPLRRGLPAPDTNGPPRIVVDAAALREPLSPLVYSQFIEHLGRCIYGGIWAEMLEDRKFYYPITTDYRPYRKLTESPLPGGGGFALADRGGTRGRDHEHERLFVGRHTPLVRAGTGLRQLDLGLAAGKTYTGYVWLRSAAANAHFRGPPGALIGRPAIPSPWTTSVAPTGSIPSNSPPAGPPTRAGWNCG